jgi:ribonuclease Z
MVEINILGSGSSLPMFKRFSPSQIVKIEGKTILIDCGEGTQIQLQRFGFSILNIDYILISHLHGDHFFGLFGLLSSMLLLGRTKPLTIFANKNLIPILEIIFQDKLSGKYFPFDFLPLDFNNINKIIEEDKFMIYSFPLDHSVPTCGFMIQEKQRPRNIIKSFVELYHPSISDIKNIKQGADYFDKNSGKLFKNEEITTQPPQPFSYVYCSDTAYTLINYSEIQNPIYLFTEATFLQEKIDTAKSKKHMTASEAALLACHLNAQHLILGHFSSEYREIDLFKKEASQHFPFDKIILAYDGFKIKYDNYKKK